MWEMLYRLLKWKKPASKKLQHQSATERTFFPCVSLEKSTPSPWSLVASFGSRECVGRPSAKHGQQADKGETSDSEEKRCDVIFF